MANKKVNEIVDKPEIIEAAPVVMTSGKVNCPFLTIRAKADIKSDIVTILPEGIIVGIDPSKSTKDFYSINIYLKEINKAVDAFCMKKFITSE